MNVLEAIEKRRALRSIKGMDNIENVVQELAHAASLTPSCANNQPWRYVFVYEKEQLEKFHQALSKGNKWAQAAPLMVAVLSKKDLDCVITDREYYLFDTGMATAFILLRATEMGLIAHPMAGFSPQKTREALDIPEEMHVITVIAIGPEADELNPDLSEKQISIESVRPERLPIEDFISHNKYEASGED